MEKASSPAKATSKKKPTKAMIALAYLLEKHINQLDALSLYGDTCLNSTISELRHKHGLIIYGTLEPHRHRGGGVTHFMRYRLAPQSHTKAVGLVSGYDKGVAHGMV